jgi:actin-like ATPase involved in cell morphogenesis
MSYSLGVDLGATSCAAAARRGTALQPCVLGEATATMPAVVLPRRDGTALVGDEADRRSRYEPTLVARMVTSRLGEPGPIVIDGEVCDPVALTEVLLGAVIDRSAAALGERPDQVVVTFPLGPGEARELVLTEAAERVTGGTAILVPEPVAAVAKLAHDRDLGADTIVAVVDFGGSSVDVTLVRRTPAALDLVGDPASLTGVGGTDLDAAMLSLVEGAIGDVTSMTSPDDHAGMLALRRLRVACRTAKERLSTDHAAVVEVALPHARAQVEITRDAFERAVDSQLDAAVDLVLATIDAAGLIPADLGLALLTGGSARIPRLSQLVTERTGLAVVTDAAPELTVALGAALFADAADAAPGPSAPSEHAPLPPEPPEALPLLAAPVAATDAWPDPPAAPTGAWPDPPGDAQPWPDPPAAPTGAWPDPPGEEEPAVADWTHDDRWELEPWAEWHEPEPAQRWDDPRTSVFDPRPPPVPAAGAAGSDADWGQSGGDEFQRLTTSDTNPFGSRAGSLSARRRHRDDEWDDEDDDDDRSPDMRLVIGAVVAAALVVLLGGFVLLSSTGDSSGDRIAVADTVATTSSTSSFTSTTTTEPPTTTESTTTSTTEPPTTTTQSRPRRTTTTTEPPAPTTTSPPPPTTTTTAPTTTTTTAPTTTPTTGPPTTPTTGPPTSSGTGK